LIGIAISNKMENREQKKKKEERKGKKGTARKMGNR
jgi:hypothetical protein